MIPRLAIVAIALIAGLVPLPSASVERWYSMGMYPRFQAIVTTASNMVPIALFDVAAVVLIVAAVWIVRRAARAGWRRAVRSVMGTAVVTAAVGYLIFLVMWGFNYRRVPLEEKVVYDTSRVTRQAAIDLANGAIGRLNRNYDVAYGLSPDPGALERAFDGVQRTLGTVRPAVVGRPKRSALTLYFRRAAIDGMTDPFFLEIIVNPDVLPFERPFVLAHEWAHLAGYASESDANFVAWLTCLRADAMAQYSGWIAAYQHAAGALSREERAKLVPLKDGPRNDLRAMVARYRRSTPLIRHAAREVYDSYLKANRVSEGIGSYDAVLRLMLGSRFDDSWAPQLRSR